MFEDLAENSLALYQESHDILKKTMLNEALSELGHVEIIGSFRLNVMFRLDIDLLVISEEINKEKALDITKKWLDSGLFKKVSLIDYLNFPAKDMPLGLTWELTILHKNQEWKFDIWYLKPSEEYTHLVLNSINKFEPILSENPEKKNIILKIKKTYFDGIKYKNNVTGFDIYTAVLINGVRSVEEFDIYLKNHFELKKCIII